MLKLLLSKIFSSQPSCKDVDGFLGDYMEGVLEPGTVDKFDAHIAQCPMCMKFFEQYKQTIALTNGDSVEVPDELVSQTLTFLNQNLRP